MSRVRAPEGARPGPSWDRCPRLFRGSQSQVTAVVQPCEDSGRHRYSGCEQSSDPIGGGGWHSPNSFPPLRPLLRYSSQGIRVTTWKGATQRQLVRSQSCAATASVRFHSILVSPEGDPVPSAVGLPLASPPPNPWQPGLGLLSPWICLSWTFHVSDTWPFVSGSSH